MNRRASRILTVCAGAWLLVIWGQSCMPAVHSGAESGALLTVVQRLLPWMTDHILRKCAHFGEYALLGVFTAAALRTENTASSSSESTQHSATMSPSSSHTTPNTMSVFAANMFLSQPAPAPRPKRPPAAVADMVRTC